MDVPPGKASRVPFRRRRYGVYDLAYEVPESPSTLRIYSLLDRLRAVHAKFPAVRRLVVDTINLAPVAFVAYMAGTVWQGVYRAINLYCLTVFFDRLGDGALSSEACRCLAASWLCCAVINVQIDRMHSQSLEVLTKRFRAYFMPQLIRASLRVDLLSIQDLCTVFPGQGRFESEFPGGRFLTQLGQLVHRTLDLTCQVLVLVYAISCERSPEWEILLCFCIARGLVWWLAPWNGIGGSAFVYWHNNRHFQRMKALFGLAFSTEYRADLMLDGIASSIETEYEKSAEQLGDIDVFEPTPWRTDFWRDWYWDVLMDITLDYQLAVYALLFSAYLSPSSISSMMLLQQATKSISLSIGQYTGEEIPSLLNVCSHAEWLYEAIDYQTKMPQGTEPFPRLIDGPYDAGMKISFRHVSLLYPGGDHQALHNVSFDILPGELVLVVGTNGSGKSTMLKLLARLFDPTAGEILIDDVPLVRYDAVQLRAAMAFQSQSPVVYPVSVRENIAFSLPPTLKRDVTQAHVEEAARMGGCSEWIARLGDGYDTQLRPSFDVNNGWAQGIYGYPSEALKEELARHNGPRVSISGGEKQRLATARTFMRIQYCPTRLVVVDEATSALDPVAEHAILSAFRKLRGTGKTLVAVTHRFHHLAHEADRILCMKDGSVVECGTHAELVRLDGTYAALYHAQIGRSA